MRSRRSRRSRSSRANLGGNEQLLGRITGRGDGVESARQGFKALVGSLCRSTHRMRNKITFILEIKRNYSIPNTKIGLSILICNKHAHDDIASLREKPIFNQSPFRSDHTPRPLSYALSYHSIPDHIHRYPPTARYTNQVTPKSPRACGRPRKSSRYPLAPRPPQAPTTTTSAPT